MTRYNELKSQVRICVFTHIKKADNFLFKDKKRNDLVGQSQNLMGGNIKSKQNLEM